MRGEGSMWSGQEQRVPKWPSQNSFHSSTKRTWRVPVPAPLRPHSGGRVYIPRTPVLLITPSAFLQWQRTVGKIYLARPISWFRVSLDFGYQWSHAACVWNPSWQNHIPQKCGGYFLSSKFPSNIISIRQIQLSKPIERQLFFFNYVSLTSMITVLLITPVR